MVCVSILDGIGWKVRGDFIAPEARERKPFLPRMGLLLEMIPMMFRYIYFAAKQWYYGTGVFINVFQQLKHDAFTGAPIGGIGCGSIGTDFRGAFNKFSLIPGFKEQWTANIKANQFILTVHSADGSTLIYQSILSCADFSPSPLSEWQSRFHGEDIRYRGLFPRAWREFHVPDLDLTLVCEQISPVIPHNYEDSSFPVCNFQWTVTNDSKTEYLVALTFTFRNGTGDSHWEKESECEACELETKSSKGMMLNHSINLMPVTFAVAVEETSWNETSCCAFDPVSKSGSDIWRRLIRCGSLAGSLTSGRELGIAVSSRFQVSPSESRTSKFCLVWHMPVVQFGRKSRTYKRWYTRFVGVEDDAVAKLVEAAATKGEWWRTEIEKWQRPILEDNSLPEWYRSALFNEIYYIVDGSTVWFQYDPTWIQTETKFNPLTEAQLKKYGRFGYMESWEYLMINTYDVHFYASWALLKNWPHLELSIQLEFCDQLNRRDNTPAISLKEGKKMQMKTHFRIPHDVGLPRRWIFNHGEPWVETNAYILHDTSNWRDLNLKFVLTCWRDYKLIVERYFENQEAEDFLHYFFTQSEIVMHNALTDWDDDDDGMIENSGTADQTYDVWTMTGTSAYCGSLWLAALSAISFMAEKLEEVSTAQYFTGVLEKAKAAFVKKLWNGKYFKFDESSTDDAVIMADQLCGIWSNTMLQENPIISESQILSTLDAIYSHNVMMFASGTMGPVNGMYEDGEVDISSIQSDEVWTGTAYSVASFMIAKNKREQGFATARGVYETCWYKLGLQYQTPEAIYEKKFYRAIGYMRPLAIWAMQHALEMKTE